jgi:hypothetical protein
MGQANNLHTYHTLGSIGPVTLSPSLFREQYDFSNVNALLGGLGIHFVSKPLLPKSTYRFSALMSRFLGGKRYRSTGFELTFRKYIDYREFNYEYGPGGHKFTYEGPLDLRQIVIDEFDLYLPHQKSYEQTYSYGILSREQELQNIHKTIQQDISTEFRFTEGLIFFFNHASELNF